MPAYFRAEKTTLTILRPPIATLAHLSFFPR